jgi:hypothetical protein
VISGLLVLLLGLLRLVLFNGGLGDELLEDEVVAFLLGCALSLLLVSVGCSYIKWVILFEIT